MFDKLIKLQPSQSGFFLWVICKSLLNKIFVKVFDLVYINVTVSSLFIQAVSIVKWLYLCLLCFLRCCVCISGVLTSFDHALYFIIGFNIDFLENTYLIWINNKRYVWWDFLSTKTFIPWILKYPSLMLTFAICVKLIAPRCICRLLKRTSL